MKILRYLFFVTLFLLILVAIFSLPIQAAVPSGNYLQLFGGYVRSANSDQSVPAGFTFEAWIKPEKTSGIQPIFTARNNIGGADNYNYLVGINGNSLAFNYTYGNGSRVLVTAGSLSSGVWTHIAVTLSPANTRLFINGQQVFINSTNISGLHSIGPDIYMGTSYIAADQTVITVNSSFNTSLRSGIETPSNSSSFTGDIDEVRVSSTVRDVPALWNSGTYNQPLLTDGNTVLLWHLDETRGVNVAVDASVNHLNGSLIGGDGKIHFYGILPTPTFTPTPTPWSNTLPPIDWQRPVFTLPTLSYPFPINGNPVSSQPTPQVSSQLPTYVRNLPRISRSIGR